MKTTGDLAPKANVVRCRGVAVSMGGGWCISWGVAVSMGGWHISGWWCIMGEWHFPWGVVHQWGGGGGTFHGVVSYPWGGFDFGPHFVDGQLGGGVWLHP